MIVEGDGEPLGQDRIGNVEWRIAKGLRFAILNSLFAIPGRAPMSVNPRIASIENLIAYDPPREDPLSPRRVLPGRNIFGNTELVELRAVEGLAIRVTPREEILGTGTDDFDNGGVVG